MLSMLRNGFSCMYDDKMTLLNKAIKHPKLLTSSPENVQ